MSRLLSNVFFALKGVTRNKIRSFLTLLGILIGIGSVIALQSIGDGAQEQIVGDFESLGTDVITVNQMMPNFSAFDDHAANPGQRPDMEEMQDMQPQSQLGGNNLVPLTLSDFDYLVENDIDGVDYMSPTMVIDVDVMEMGSDQYTSASVTAVNYQYFDVYDLSLSEGEFFDEVEKEDDLVAVIGSDIVDVDYYDPDKDVLYIEDIEVPVIGILEPKEASLFEEDTNSQIFIPYKLRSEIGYESSDVSLIVIKASGSEVVSSVATEVEELLLEYREEDLKEATFSVFTIEQLTDRITMFTDTFTMLLSAIAAISLLVGGIGIGNVMLISVTERIREIGIRKAIGARNFDILMQFLLEAIFLSMIGGALGIATGYGLAYLVQRWIDVTPIYTLESIVYATGVSIAVGVVCGFLPALRASRLNPIDALRYE